MTEPLIQYAIYENPADHPNHFVVRRWLIGDDGAQPGAMAVFDTIDQARASLPAGVDKTAFADPDPTIVEVWM